MEYNYENIKLGAPKTALLNSPEMVKQITAEVLLRLVLKHFEEVCKEQNCPDHKTNNELARRIRQFIETGR
jgi:hypothetical protein